MRAAAYRGGASRGMAQIRKIYELQWRIFTHERRKGDRPTGFRRRNFVSVQKWIPGPLYFAAVGCGRIVKTLGCRRREIKTLGCRRPELRRSDAVASFKPFR